MWARRVRHFICRRIFKYADKNINIEKGVYFDNGSEMEIGDYSGIGLAGLISGADKYYAFDVVKYSTTERNVRLFYELVDLFRARKDIPDKVEFPDVKPYLKSYQFPRHILDDARLNVCLQPDRIQMIKDALLNCDNNSFSRRPILIKYCVPWYDSSVLEKESVDMIYSQAVLEHVDNLDSVYQTLFHWLKPNGFMSHQIDFKCHRKAEKWNGHWAYSDFVWKVIRGKRTYLLNREPHSVHINLQKKAGFKILADIRIQNTTGIARKHLAPRFKHLSDDDLTTSGAFIMSVKQNKYRQ